MKIAKVLENKEIQSSRVKLPYKILWTETSLVITLTKIGCGASQCYLRQACYECTPELRHKRHYILKGHKVLFIVGSVASLAMLNKKCCLL